MTRRSDATANTGSASVQPDLRIRRAVRAVLLDPADRVLLARFDFPTAIVWALPGGGVEQHEDPLDALRRELAEELGLVGADIGPHVWSRLHVIPMLNGAFDGQADQIHLVRTAAFAPEPQIGWDRLNAEYVHELRWWTLAEVLASSALFAPRRLGELLGRLLVEGTPADPIDTGV
jgi:8-oxo-dGTP pyrophosphatase MutT (NUDIX family)